MAASEFQETSLKQASPVKRVSIIGAGWAGLAAAVAARRKGFDVDLFEATPTLGGRARALAQTHAGHTLDNGQHILIGAYRDSLALMRQVGLDPERLLLRQPLDLRLADGQGLRLPHGPAGWPLPGAWSVLAGVACARGWTLTDKWRLLRASAHWQAQGFTCPADWSVAQLCRHHGLTPRVVTQLIEPLCLSALNTAVHEASASVFLRVAHDALLGGPGNSDALLPRCDLGDLLPEACQAWLTSHGARVHTHRRITADDLRQPEWTPHAGHTVLVATPARDAARLLADHQPDWARHAASLAHRAIATVYLQCHDAGFAGLPRPMVALHSGPSAPAQFVFCRSRLSLTGKADSSGTPPQTGPSRLLAAVVSDCTHERAVLEQHVPDQLRSQLGLQDLSVVQTVIEKRATLACTPQLQRPPSRVSQHVWACGDYVQGPYPSTLEGAVRSALAVVAQI